MDDDRRQLALDLLLEAENEPRGLSFLDVEELLTAWGVTEVVPGEKMIGYRSLFHPSDPKHPFHFPERMELSPNTVLNICRALRNLERRLGVCSKD
jgi:hypothetical protein